MKISITKYNPKYRDQLGHYEKDEWTSYSDIGKSFEGLDLNKSEYLNIEDKYVRAVKLVMEYFKADYIQIGHVFKYIDKSKFEMNDDLELYDSYKVLEKGKIIKEPHLIADLIKLRLREYVAELEVLIGQDPVAEIHFGFDFYMYLITNEDIQPLKKKIEDIGLFIY